MEASTALTPRLEQAGIEVVEHNGVRVLEIPETLRAKCNVLVPVSEIIQANPLWQPAIRAVRLDKARHSYPGQKKGELALNKHAVLLLARTAGIDVLGTSRMPISVLRDNEIGWQATVRVRRADGTHEEMTESRVMDLTIEREAIDFQVNTAPWNADKPEHVLAQERQKRWLNERPHFDAKAETKALLRAVRAVLQLPHAFTEQDFAKPFLVLTYAFSPDTNDPEVMRALITAGVNGAATMYGTPRAIEAPQHHEYEPVEGEIPMGDATEAAGANAPDAGVVSGHAVEEGTREANSPAPAPAAPTHQPEPEPTGPPESGLGAHKIDFGKHSGGTVASIYRDDPSYISWLSDNARDPKLKQICADYIAQQGGVS